MQWSPSWASTQNWLQKGVVSPQGDNEMIWCIWIFYSDLIKGNCSSQGLRVRWTTVPYLFVLFTNKSTGATVQNYPAQLEEAPTGAERFSAQLLRLLPPNSYQILSLPGSEEWWSRSNPESGAGCHPRCRGCPCSPSEPSARSGSWATCPRFLGSGSSSFLLLVGAGDNTGQ